MMSALTLGKNRKASVAAALALSLAMLTATPQGAESLARAADSFARSVAVIVQGESSDAAAVAVEAVGGDVTRRLSIIDGVAAEVPADRISVLERRPGVRAVSEDTMVGFQGDADPITTAKRIGKITRSEKLWNEGVTGKGITVALLDTGVYSAHPDLAGRVIACQDFSHEAGTEAECQDTFGHGTFMAGLIAGNGASSGGMYVGAAPQAKIVSVKLAGFDGSADVSNVLAGIQWAVAHKSLYGIRVMNLSLGTDSTQSTKLSPLNYAVQKAWKSGIVVVVSAGNSGPNSRTVLKPADDPLVVTVGASDDQGTLAIGNDTVPVFSSRGPTASNGLAKPDIVAPGVHTVSLRSPGSAIDQYYGVTAAVGDGYFRGTGTSMSAATVTGIAAQILQVKPTLDPDQVKYRLTSTAKRIADTNSYSAGKGIVDAYAAARSTSTRRANSDGLLGGLIDSLLSTGLGSIQGARGTLGIDVITPKGSGALLGEFQAQYSPNIVSNVLGLLPWDGLTFTLTGWDPTTWSLTSWLDGVWTGVSWDSAKWKQTTWDSAKWKGSEFYNAEWESAKWKDVEWDSAKWKATSWQSAWYAAAWD